MSHTKKNQKVVWIQSKPTWSLSQKLSGLIRHHNSSCQKVDEDHGCIHNLDLEWQCSPPAASVSLQKIVKVIHSDKWQEQRKIVPGGKKVVIYLEHRRSACTCNLHQPTKSQKEKKRNGCPSATAATDHVCYLFRWQKKKKPQNSLKAYREHNYKAITMTA